MQEEDEEEAESSSRRRRGRRNRRRLRRLLGRIVRTVANTADNAVNNAVSTVGTVVNNAADTASAVVDNVANTVEVAVDGSIDVVNDAHANLHGIVHHALQPIQFPQIQIELPRVARRIVNDIEKVAQDAGSTALQATNNIITIVGAVDDEGEWVFGEDGRLDWCGLGCHV